MNTAASPCDGLPKSRATMEKKTQTKAFSADISVIEGERAVSAVISTTAVDRDGEVLIPQGCNWKDYSDNPVVFYNHAYADFLASSQEKMPVGRCEGMKRTDHDIRCKIVFASRPSDYPAEQEWLPDTLLSLYQQGIMRAFSVGFMPMEVRPATSKDLATFGADCQMVTSKWKLLEVSCVPLPANQEAVALAVSKGLVTEKRAKEIFGEKETGRVPEEPKPIICSVCGKEMSDDDEMPEDMPKDKPTCKGCREHKNAPEPIVKVIGALAPEPEEIIIDLSVPPPAPSVRTLVMTEFARLKGRIYLD